MAEKAKLAKDVPEYIAAAPQETRAQLRELRKLVRAAVPKAVESIGYGIPYYKYNGRPLASFAAFKAHVSVFGMPVHEYKAETDPYVAAKGTLHFPIGDRLPEALLAKLVKARAKAIEAEKKK
jgi:uncharacterized protein YdhG (YjbR/CyaY superfamily)